MNRSTFAMVLFGALALAGFAGFELRGAAPQSPRYFEMRTYIANEGKLDALNARFRDHTNTLFKKHGIDVIGYWIPTDPAKSKNTLVYILAYPSKEARDQSWAAFRKDPDWIKAKSDSEKDGVLVGKVIEEFLTPTDYSPIK